MPAKKVVVEASMGEGFAMESSLGGHVLHVDQPTAMGGTDTGPTPLQYLELSLAGCIGAIGRIVANQKKLPVRGMKITVSGELDTDGLLGKSTDNRVGFGGFEVSVEIDADMSAAEKKAFLAEVDARCPVSDNIAAATPVSFRVVE